MSFVKFKTIVPKDGELSSYLNKPVLDRVDLSNTFETKTIGVISDAVEVEEGYELTIQLFSKFQYEWIGNELNALSILAR
ncbi:hypothetical protein [Halalkalibacter oceani]|uniref:hypothetical protein n=1 Tax=Halalkalibacter oceani TaxID=1653776 RepID=UPI003393D104